MAIRILACTLAGAAVVVISAGAQTVEMIDGVRTVHNVKGGAWGASPRIRLELVRTYGGPEEKDPNLAFGSPYGVVRDSAGFTYVLDFRAKQVQKIDPDGRFVKSIGRSGQGPGEFMGPLSLAIDGKDLLLVADGLRSRIEVFDADGRPLRSIALSTRGPAQIRRLPSGLIAKGNRLNLRTLMAKPKNLPALVELIDLDGKTKATFGAARPYGDPLVDSTANEFDLDADSRGNVFLSFWYQNRVDKYDHEGNPVWRADRPLTYGTEVIDKGFVKTDEKGTSIQSPVLNMVSIGVAADGAGRVWVNTYNRQLTKEERGSTVTIAGAAQRTQKGRIAKMDIYKLEIFGPDGVLLGEIPLDHLAHGIGIFGDTLYIWEREEATVYQYRIVEIGAD